MMNATSLTSKPTLFAIIFALSFIHNGLLSGSPARATERAKPEVMTLSALESSWDWRTLKLTLNGAVQFKRGPLSVKCEQATILFQTKNDLQAKDSTLTSNLSWSDSGLELVSIEANGKVEFTQHSLHLSARKIVYNHLKKSIQTSGEVRGRWKEHRLSGQDLKVNLDRGEAALRKLYLILETGSLSDSMKSLFNR